MAMPRFTDLTPAEQLNHLTELALQDFHNILAVPLHVRPQYEWPMWLRAKIRAGGYVLAAKLRVDEASLRKRELDALPRLLQQIAKANADDPALDL
jgi:hypothetical protein